MRGDVKLRIGLTGGIGSGKSTVASLLHELGADVIDADAISRACTLKGGSAIPLIEQRFGPAYIGADGGLDRALMRERIFSHPDSRAILESIVHPIVAQEIQTQSAASTARCLVFDVPLLVESPRWRQQLDLVLVIDCRIETQVARVGQRNGLDPIVVQNIINAQSSRERRLAAADLVIYNNDNHLEDLRTAVIQLAVQFGL